MVQEALWREAKLWMVIQSKSEMKGIDRHVQAAAGVTEDGCRGRVECMQEDVSAEVK